MANPPCCECYAGSICPKRVACGFLAQKQWMCIARALVKGASLVVLDEATSALDSVTEAKLQETFEKLAHGRTTIIIAHRLSTVRNASLILVTRDGRIVEQGRHEELLQKGGFYAELYNSQFDHS